MNKLTCPVNFVFVKNDEHNLTFVEVEDLEGNGVHVGTWNEVTVDGIPAYTLQIEPAHTGLNELAKQFAKHAGVERGLTPNVYLERVTEELREAAQSGANLGYELADVVLAVCTAAYGCGIDLDACIEHKHAHNLAASWQKLPNGSVRRIKT
jgi:hypothetical protein